MNPGLNWYFGHNLCRWWRIRFGITLSQQTFNHRDANLAIHWRLEVSDIRSYHHGCYSADAQVGTKYQLRSWELQSSSSSLKLESLTKNDITDPCTGWLSRWVYICQQQCSRAAHPAVYSVIYMKQKLTKCYCIISASQGWCSFGGNIISILYNHE